MRCGNRGNSGGYRCCKIGSGIVVIVVVVIVVVVIVGVVIVEVDVKWSEYKEIFAEERTGEGKGCRRVRNVIGRKCGLDKGD